jgi:hypothetical protein
VSATRFGASTGLLARLRPERVDVDDLRDIAAALLPCLSSPGLRAHLQERPHRGSVVVLEEDERSLRVPLLELADDMTRAGVRPTATGITTALGTWIAHRPVTDAAAAAAGIAVVDWADGRRRGIGRRVVVRRGELTLPWQPFPSCDDAAVDGVRAAAHDRSADVPLELRVEGPVALWSHPTDPALATAALMSPEQLLPRAAAAGLAFDDMHVVVTPGHPVACAEPGVARRLAGETAEACVIVPWRSLTDLPWL